MHLVRQLRCGLALFLTAILIVPAGCTRRFYRQQADKQVEEVLTEKDRDPWKIEQWHVYPDPLARFGDPNNPDKPPMPFDDPATLMAVGIVLPAVALMASCLPAVRAARIDPMRALRTE